MSNNHGTHNETYTTIPMTMIEPDSECVRKADTDIGGLKYTISDVGLLQPILVRKAGDKYLVIDGHRRLRALRELYVKDLIVGREVIVADDETDADNRFKQIIANIQREDIGDIELGHAFVILKQAYGYHYNEIAEIVGKDRHYVTAKVGLATRLVPEVRKLAAEDLQATRAHKISAGAPDNIYAMNVNILEAIARLPKDLQMEAYLKVMSDKMDKPEAFKLIRSMKDECADPVREDRGGLTESGRVDSKLYHYVRKVNEDVDQLAVKIKKDNRDEKEKILPIIESLIEKLSSLRSEIADDRQIPGKGKCEARLPGTA